PRETAGVAEGHGPTELLRLGDGVVEPRLAATLDEVQAQFGGEARGARGDFRVEGERGAAGCDRLEQVFGGEVEARELFRGEHADGETRGRHGGLNEHAVELELHHSPEPCDEPAAEQRWNPDGDEGVDL